MSDRELRLDVEDGLEQELRVALRRVDAPPGLATWVQARASAREVRGGWWKAIAASFLLGAASGGWLMHHERVERRQAMETTEQFRVAMRVTARVTERSFSQAEQRINRTVNAGETR